MISEASLPVTKAGDKVKENPLFNMQMIASIILPDGNVSVYDGDEVYAYVGEECRGIAQTYADMDGRIFLTIGSDIESGEKLSFRVYRPSEDKVYNLVDNVVFSSEAGVGTYDQPYEFKLSSASEISSMFGNSGIIVGEVYPNPFKSLATLDFTLPEAGDVDIRIYNSIGQEVRTVASRRFDNGTHKLEINGDVLATGLYSLKLTYNSELISDVIVKKLIIK